MAPEQLAELIQSPEEQPDHGRPRAVHEQRYLGYRKSLQMVQLDHPALVLRQVGHRLGESQQLLVTGGALARRRLVGRKQALQSRGGLFELGLQGALLAQVACLGREPASRSCQSVRQDGAEPGEPLGFALPTKLCPALVRFQDCLLDDIRGVQFRLEAWAQLEPRE